jgi:hypothetical protein
LASSILNSVLFIYNGPINSLTDLKSYLYYTRNFYKVSFIGFNKGDVNFENIEITCLGGDGSGLFNRFKLYLNVFKKINNSNPDIIIIPYFLGCSFIAFMHKKVILDVRSSVIHKKGFVRYIRNSILKIESTLFYKHFVISKDINKYLNLSSDFSEVPLGSESYGFSIKSFDAMRLLYIGTFHLRNLHIFIDALGYSIMHNGVEIEKFSIIGYGSKLEVELILKMIKKWNLSEKVLFIGELRPPFTYDYLKSHNVGISYVPIRDYFYFQPPTKSIEYLISGMPVIATKNILSNNIINGYNGLIIGDSFEDCVEGITKFYNIFSLFNSNKIIANTELNNWEQVVQNYLIPSIEIALNE